MLVFVFIGLVRACRKLQYFVNEKRRAPSYIAPRFWVIADSDSRNAVSGYQGAQMNRFSIAARGASPTQICGSGLSLFRASGQSISKTGNPCPATASFCPAKSRVGFAAAKSGFSMAKPTGKTIKNFSPARVNYRDRTFN
jgi:hypothetical protein